MRKWRRQQGEMLLEYEVYEIREQEEKQERRQKQGSQVVLGVDEQNGTEWRHEKMV